MTKVMVFIDVPDKAAKNLPKLQRYLKNRFPTIVNPQNAEDRFENTCAEAIRGSLKVEALLYPKLTKVINQRKAGTR